MRRASALMAFALALLLLALSHPVRSSTKEDPGPKTAVLTNSTAASGDRVGNPAGRSPLTSTSSTAVFLRRPHARKLQGARSINDNYFLYGFAGADEEAGSEKPLPPAAAGGDSATLRTPGGDGLSMAEAGPAATEDDAIRSYKRLEEAMRPFHEAKYGGNLSLPSDEDLAYGSMGIADTESGGLPSPATEFVTLCGDDSLTHLCTGNGTDAKPFYFGGTNM